MDSRGRELEVVPDALVRVSNVIPNYFQSGRLDVRADRSVGRSGLMPIGPTDARRVERVFRAERRRGPAGFKRPDWPGNSSPIPGLDFSIYYAGSDAHGVTQQLRGLDLAFRRAASTLTAFVEGERIDTWRPALRPERGGIWIAETHSGSWECAGTVYGGLVTLAYSTPVALAALTSLAWQAGLGGARFAHWVARRMPAQQTRDLRLGIQQPTAAMEWGIGNTKALEPVLLESIRNGQGFEFKMESAAVSISLRVFGKEELELDELS